MKMHHSRLRDMLSTPVRCRSMDTTIPSSMQLTHLTTWGKKQQLEKEWNSKVDYENDMLLKKMERIMNRDLKVVTKSTKYRTSMTLNTRHAGTALDETQYPFIDSQLREPPSPIRDGKAAQKNATAARVQRENVAMLHRIKEAKPIVSRAEHETFSKAQSKYRSISSKPEVVRLSTSLHRQTAPRNTLSRAGASPSKGDVLQHRSGWDSTYFNPKIKGGNAFSLPATPMSTARGSGPVLAPHKAVKSKKTSRPASSQPAPAAEAEAEAAADAAAEAPAE